MTEADKQRLALESLKALNGAVTVTKLYPPTFPQVIKAVDTAYRELKNYIRRFGKFNYSLIDDEPFLCGLKVSQKVLGKMHGAEIFQQMKNLGKNNLILDKSFNQQVLQNIISFFLAPPNLIKKEGGVDLFLNNHAIAQYFPDSYSVEILPQHEDTLDKAYKFLVKKKEIDKELLEKLISEIKLETPEGQSNITLFTEFLKDRDRMVVLIVASICYVLRGMHQRGSVSAAKEVEYLQRNIDNISDTKMSKRLAIPASLLILKLLDDFALRALLLQSFNGDFANDFYDSLIGGITTRIDNLVKLVREEEQYVLKNSGKASEQYAQLVEGRDRLFETEIGKRFLIRERTQSFFKKSEKERQTSRVHTGIKAILNGNINSLRNKEVITHLPATIENLIAKGKNKAAATIIENITTELMRGEAEIHNLLSESLSLIGESLVKTKKWDWLEKLATPLMAWVRGAESAGKVFEGKIEILRQLQRYYIKNGEEEKADKILLFFFALRTSRLGKSKEIQEAVGKVQDRSIDKEYLAQLLVRALEEDDELLRRRLSIQGPVAGRILLDELLECEDTSKRLQLVNLLGCMDTLLPPLLLERLSEPMAWYGKRNIIRLLAETGSKKDVDAVYEYLKHDDERVQRAAFSCIYSLSDDKRGENLTHSLLIAPFSVKGQLLRALQPMGDDDVVTGVSGLLEKHLTFPDKFRNSLLHQIFDCLKGWHNPVATPSVESFLQDVADGKVKVIEDELLQKAKSLLRDLKATLDKEKPEEEKVV